MLLAGVTLALLAFSAAAQAPAPEVGGSLEDTLGVPSPQLLESPLGARGPDFALPPAFAPGASNSACPSTTFFVRVPQLVNQSETSCDVATNGSYSGDVYGRFGRETPFGFSFTDNHTTDCTVFSVTVALQAGVSCSGPEDGGNITFNGAVVPPKYHFPFYDEYQELCECEPPGFSPVQVFNFDPEGNYNVGGSNTLSILGSDGSNGLRPLFNEDSTAGVYAVVIVNQWISTGPLNVPRTSFAWVETPNRTVLAVGGITSDGQITGTAEEYNRTTQEWQLTANNLTFPVTLQSVANLQGPNESPDSSYSYYILSAGGVNQQNTALSNVSKYNTSSRLWTPAPSMSTARSRFELTSIYNETNACVATGGIVGFFSEQSALNSVEFYDLDTNRWWTVNNMTEARYRHQAVKPPSDNGIIVMGGQSTGGAAINSTERLDLVTMNWTVMGSMRDARYAFTATVLQNGSILVTGGAQRPNLDATWQNSDLLRSTEIYVNGTWHPSGNLNTERADHEATLLSDGTVLVAGGATGAGALMSTEIWNPRSGLWTYAAPMLVPRVKFGLATFNDDKTVAFGGATSGALGLVNGTTTSALFSPAFNFSLIASVGGPSLGPAMAPDMAVGTSDAQSPSTSPNATNSSTGASANNGGTEINQIIVDNGISGGAVGGIVAGAVGGSALLILAVFLIWRRRKRSRAHACDGPCTLDKEASGADGLDKFPGSSGPNSRSGSAHSPSAGGSAGLLKKLSTAFSKSNRGNAGSKRHLPIEAPVSDSVDLRKAVASPFGSIVDANPSFASHPFAAAAVQTPPRPAASASQRSIEMRPGLKSPFDTPLVTQEDTRSIGDPLTGASWDPQTQTSGGVSEKDDDGFSTVRLSGTRLSQRSGRSVIMSRESEASGRSDLSKVSMTIHNDLARSADWRIARSALEIGKRIGKGGFGEVFEGVHHGSTVAIKVLEMSDDRMMADACHEFGILHGFRHSKLVISYGGCVDGSKLMLVMERMDEDLFHAIASNETCARDSVLWYFRGWRIAMDIASALVFLHSKGFVHLDVKSLNILLKGNRAEAKLGDLGLAKMVKDSNLALQNTLPGTPAYSAPEVMQAQLQWRLRTQGRKDQFQTEVGTPADIFSFGVVLYEICTGSHPARWRQDFTGEFRPEQAPPTIAKLVDDCLNDDPMERPTAQEVLRILLDNRPGPSKP